VRGIKLDPEATRFGTATVANVRSCNLPPGASDMVLRADAPYPAMPAAVLPYPLVVPVWGVVTKSEANTREHHMARWRRFKVQRFKVAEALKPFAGPLAAFGREVAHHAAPLRIVLTRIGPRTLDTDNLGGALKAVRDEVAEWLGINDGNPRLDWKPDQRRGEDGVIIAVGP
jgi:hypothetical protein